MHPSQFRRLLDLLRSALSEIKDAVKQREQTIREASQTSDISRGEILRGISRVAIAIESGNADKEAHKKAESKKEYALQRRSLIAQWITAIATTGAFVGALVYACIANRQLKQMVDANHASRCATLISSQSAAESSYYSREEERAWVELWYPNGRSLALSNPGKTVAREVRVIVRTNSGDVKFGPLTISPYTFMQVPFKLPIDIVSPQHLRGEISYIDVFGVAHWNKFCFAFGEKGEMHPCQFGNEEDHNLENPPETTIPTECGQ